MNIDFLNDYLILLVVGICLCVGYMIKKSTPINNKYIPLIMGILGVILNFWINMSITPEVLLGGLFSGLASTGLYEMFRNLIGDKNDDD